MTDARLIAHCAYSCDVMAEKLRREKLTTCDKDDEFELLRIDSQRDEYLDLKEYFLSFLSPKYRTYEVIAIPKELWDGRGLTEYPLPCHHYMEAGIHISLIVQDDELDVDLPVQQPFYIPEPEIKVDPLPLDFLRQFKDYLEGAKTVDGRRYYNRS